jgi:hypothetical protein
MSAWVVALGLSAGYLINKQLQMTQQLDEQIHEFQSEAKPADPLPTSQIRKVQRTVPDGVRFADINVSELPPQEVQKLTKARDESFQEVAQYEAGQGPIQGVWLNYGDRGF